VQVKTSIFQVDVKSSGAKWSMLLDLGLSQSDLHQTTISSDGKYLMVNLQTGSNQDLPTTELVTVDLQAKKIAKRIRLQKPKDITVLSAMPCYSSEHSIAV